jgi:hypothetical protein
VRIPAAVMQDTAALAEKYPDAFQRCLDGLLLGQFRPATAAAFVEKLNDDLRKQGAAVVRLE